MSKIIKPELSRRDFFSRMTDGVYGGALAYLLGGDLLSSNPALAAVGERKVYDLMPQKPHFEPKAKALIHLFMNGGPSQLDLFDPKPMLKKYEGQPPSREIANDIEFIEDAGGLMPSPFKFTKHGQSGIEISELMPHLAKQADDLAIIRSTVTTHFNHEPAIFMFQSGSVFSGRPSTGAWVVYGLGTENQNLPAYVVLDDPKGLPVNGIQNWQTGWLPPVYQGTRMRSTGSPLLNLSPKKEYPAPVLDMARSMLDQINNAHRSQRPQEQRLDARILSYELAARMQMTATDALDVSQESPATQEMYGINNDASASYGRRCLMARRLVERGVRVVQIFVNEQIWDNHSDLESGLRTCCEKTDQPIGALIKDLKQRGLLDSTLIVWGGEFGRMPLSQIDPRRKSSFGRDHQPAAFTTWMAGGGIKGGTVYGATDEIGFKPVENPVSIHDFHATILHLLGMDHLELVYNHQGLGERLTGVVPARVVKGIVA